LDDPRKILDQLEQKAQEIELGRLISTTEKPEKDKMFELWSDDEDVTF